MRPSKPQNARHPADTFQSRENGHGYHQHAQRTGIEWTRRDYDTADFDAGTPVNQALSTANTSLHGVVHAVIVALGCTPGLGFVHTGHAKSFVYDAAERCKADITIAFDIAGRDVADVATETRRAVRDHVRTTALLDTCVQDVKTLLNNDDTVEYGPEAFDNPGNVVMLWDDRSAAVAAGTNYDDLDEDR